MNCVSEHIVDVYFLIINEEFNATQKGQKDLFDLSYISVL